ncbi:hypothetical protein L5I01_07785 [Gordonia sp. HY442]|uniref:hypothetical protein n=1 Tax=Gordonia zhenghanii TaxID=2911516 RepID=UPI001F27AF26|nr:hypothetical protein [Gordonia zhenghanii]MCF8603260.1 hypothetical protein [Gordonia zhenghanii]
MSIDADARKALEGVTPRSSPANVLIGQFWGGVSKDGYVTSGDPLYGCGDLDTSDYGPFHQTLAIGRKARGVMYFALPADAVKLQVAYFESPGWEWDLPSR